MEAFSQNLMQRHQNTTIQNIYDKETDTTKNKVIKMQSLSFTQYSTTKEAMQYYLRGAVLVIAGVFTSAITYPLSVRVAKQVFRLKHFLNIHMAALPIIMNANAFVLGITQGCINYYFLTQKYPIQSQTASLLQQL